MLHRSLPALPVTAGVLFLLTFTLSSQPAAATDLIIIKNASSLEVMVGDRFTYMLTVDNSSTAGGGPFDSPNTIVIDDMPAALKIIDVTVSEANVVCTVEGQRIRCELGTLARDATVTITITVEACEAGTVVNAAQVSGDLFDPNTNNNNASIMVTIAPAPADLAITKTGPDTTIAGSVPFTYEIVVKNNGPQASPNTQMIDHLPAGVTVDSVTTTRPSCVHDLSMVEVRCALGTLAAGDSVTIRIYARAVAAAGMLSFINTAEVSGDLPDPNFLNDVALVETQVRLAPFLVLTMTAATRTTLLSPNTKVPPLQFVRFEHTVTNVGSLTARAVEASSTYANARVTTLTPRCMRRLIDVKASSVDCTVGDLAVGASFSYTVSGFILSGARSAGFINFFDASGVNTNRPQIDFDFDISKVSSALLLVSTGPSGNKRAEHLDLYLDDERLADDYTLGEARSLSAVPLASAIPTLYVVDGDDPDASAPIDSFVVDLIVEEADSLRLSTSNAFFLVETADSLDLLVKRDFRFEARDPAQIDLFIAQAAPEAPPLDLRLLDDTPQHTVLLMLADDLPYDSLTEYLALAPAAYNVEVMSAVDDEQLGVFRFDFSRLAGQALMLTATGNPLSGTFSLVAYDATGAPVEAVVVTDTERRADVPGRFVLRGNYPNPFHPTTSITFDLPERAQVRVEIIDLLGRRVLALPGQTVPAGAGRTLAVDASSLASGLYVYRMVAKAETRTMLATGRMLLLK